MKLMNNMESDFTIVIPYHAEPETFDFLRRQLDYYHHNSTPMKVIMAISGDEDVQKRIKELLKELDDDRFSMFTVQERNVKNNEAFVQKIYDALKLVQTPCVVLNGADDVVIPEMVSKGAAILAENPGITATKGYTVCFDVDTGAFIIINDSEILSDNPLSRIKEAMQDRDSIFYIIRKTNDLLNEFDNIVSLVEKSKTVESSLYHIEHFMALSVAARGKVHVFKEPWRLYNVHDNNHTAHTPASFIRVEMSVVDKPTYEWFQSVTPNMEYLNYQYYTFLWTCHQIEGVSVTFKQILYRFLYKNLKLKNALRIVSYWLFNKVFVLTKKLFSAKNVFLDKEIFINTKHSKELKQHYFSEENIRIMNSIKIRIDLGK